MQRWPGGARWSWTTSPDPTPGEGEALIAVTACGICGSDLHTLRHAHSMLALASMTGAEDAFDPDADFVMGHEFCGEVLELAPRPTGCRPVSATSW